MDHIETLRRLAFHHPGPLRTDDRTPLTPRDAALIRFAAAVADGANETSLSVAVDAAISAQLTVPELVGVLAALAPDVGMHRVVVAAQRLIVALQLDDDPVIAANR